MARWLTIFFLAVMLAGGMTACGRKSDPIPPNEDESTFPQTYPRR